MAAKPQFQPHLGSKSGLVNRTGRNLSGNALIVASQLEAQLSRLATQSSLMKTCGHQSVIETTR
jgi:hypothetical protein